MTHREYVGRQGQLRGQERVRFAAALDTRQSGALSLTLSASVVVATQVRGEQTTLSSCKGR